MNKKRPANMVVSAMLATIIFIIIANCFMNLWGNSFTTLTAAKTATQAQAYSDIVSEKIKLEGTDAEEVTTKTKLSEITGNDSDDDWFYTYEIENETEDDNGNVFKVASIKIYKDDENSPRYSTEIPLSSLGNSTDGLEVGMVVAWTLSANPSDNYLECNGQAVDSTKYPKLYALMHNVPDYRGVFLRGLGSVTSNHYGIVSHSSADLGILQGDAIRNITGTMGGSASDKAGLWDYGTGVFYQFNLGRDSVEYSGRYYNYVSQGMGFDASHVVPVANENRPINKAVRYFIKAK